MKTEPELKGSSLDWDGRVAAAHAGVAALQGQFLAQFAADRASLKTMIAEVGAEPTQTELEPIRRLAHDLKGKGEVFCFAIISMIAASLHAYLGGAAPSVDGIKAHVAALAQVVEFDLTGDGGEQGRKILERLANST